MEEIGFYKRGKVLGFVDKDGKLDGPVVIQRVNNCWFIVIYQHGEMTGPGMLYFPDGDVMTFAKRTIRANGMVDPMISIHDDGTYLSVPGVAFKMYKGQDNGPLSPFIDGFKLENKGVKCLYQKYQEVKDPTGIRYYLPTKKSGYHFYLSTYNGRKMVVFGDVKDMSIYFTYDCDQYYYSLIDLRKIYPGLSVTITPNMCDPVKDRTEGVIMHLKGHPALFIANRIHLKSPYAIKHGQKFNFRAHKPYPAYRY